MNKVEEEHISWRVVHTVPETWCGDDKTERYGSLNSATKEKSLLSSFITPVMPLTFKEQQCFHTKEEALLFFEECAAKNLRPILYKLTERIELEQFNIGVIE